MTCIIIIIIFIIIIYLLCLYNIIPLFLILYFQLCFIGGQDMDVMKNKHSLFSVCTDKVFKSIFRHIYKVQRSIS